MRRPTAEEIDAYCERYGVSPDVAWRDYLQLRLAEATSRDAKLRDICIWKGAFVMRNVLDSPRASGDLDATVGRNKDKIDPPQIRSRLLKACEDMGLEIPKPAEMGPGDQAVSFEPIVWRDAEIGNVYTSIDLSMREEVLLTPVRHVVRSGLVPDFEVLLMDLHEQAAEKMRCLAQRERVGDGMDVFLLWRHGKLDPAVVRRLVPKKLTSGANHRQAAQDGVAKRYTAWNAQIGRELPHDAPSRNEMREACLAAIDEWIPR